MHKCQCTAEGCLAQPRENKRSRTVDEPANGKRAKLNFFEKRKHCDVVFIVGEEEKEIKAHKLYLAEVSPVFEAMFYGAMKIKDKFVAEPDSIQ